MRGIDIETDVVVVGSGIGGALAAHAAASQGRHVTVLERGLMLLPGLVERAFAAHSLYACRELPTTAVTLDDGRKPRERSIPITFGGLANFYAAVSLRMREAELQRWPIDYSAIEPYYGRAEVLLDVAGAPGEDPTEPPRSTPYPHLLPPASTLARVIAAGAEAVGIRAFRHPLAIRFGHGCRRCLHCNQVPCPVGVKFTPARLLTESTALSLDLRPGLRAERLVFADDGRTVAHLEAHRGQEPVRVRARHFVLAGGALETPALLMRSGVAERLPLVGTHLMTHASADVWGYFGRPISAVAEFDKWLTVSDFYFDDAGRVRGILQQEALPPLPHLPRRVPALLQSFVHTHYCRTAVLGVFAEDEPQPSNHVELRADGRLCLHRVFSAADRARRDFLVRQARRLLRAAGARFTVRSDTHSVFHACGTCRMGTDERTSVTDPWGRVWCAENVFVADGSLLPTATGLNPSLTIAALGLRVGDAVGTA